jgi:hypothetical protein
MARERNDSREIKVIALLAAASWATAIVAAIDWARGNPTAPTGVITFSLIGALFTAIAIATHRERRR